MIRQAIIAFAAVGLAAGFALPAFADDWETRIGLQCRSDVVAIRAGGRWNEDPVYWHPLPPAYAKAWESVPFSTNNACTLANGDKVVMRSGQSRSYATGPGAVDPPAFVSLWINGKKILSREIYKAGYGNAITGPYVNSWFVSATTVERCAYPDDGGIGLQTRLDITCTAKALNLAALSVDPLEPSPEAFANSQFTFTAAYNPDFCHRFIRKMSEIYPNVKGAGADSETLAPPPEATYPFANDADPNYYGAAAVAKKMDFWNSGIEDLIVRVWMSNSWYDSENYVFANLRGANEANAAAQVARANAEASNRQNRDFDLRPLKQDGWYPATESVGNAVRVFRLDGVTFLLTTQTDNMDVRTGTLVRPGGRDNRRFEERMETICTFQQRRQNF